jgi:hypothetical protein
MTPNPNPIPNWKAATVLDIVENEAALAVPVLQCIFPSTSRVVDCVISKACIYIYIYIYNIYMYLL